MFKFLLPLLLLSPLAHTEDNRWDYFKNVTVLNLQAEARETVTQDRLKATLNIEHEAKTAEEVQNFINSKMTAALKAGKSVGDVKVQTGRYNVRKKQPYDRKLTLEQRERRTTWVGSQTVILDSDDRADILKLAGGIQSMGFTMSNLTYYLSREKSDAQKADLSSRAIQNVQERAAAIAKQLGLPKIHFANINFGHRFPQPRRYNEVASLKSRAFAASADAVAEPVAAGGENDVVVTVSTEVHLSR